MIDVTVLCCTGLCADSASTEEPACSANRASERYQATEMVCILLSTVAWVDIRRNKFLSTTLCLQLLEIREISWNLLLLLEKFITMASPISVLTHCVYNSWKYWKSPGILLYLEKFITQSYTSLSVCCWYYVWDVCIVTKHTTLVWCSFFAEK